MTDFEEHKDKNKIFHESLEKSISLTIVVFILYIYQKVLNNNKKHGIYSFFVLFVCLMCVFYALGTNVPDFHTNVQNGIGWGLGATLLKQILHI